MNTTRAPESKRSTKEAKTTDINPLIYILENNVYALKLLVEPNLLTYDMQVETGTVLSYAKSKGVKQETLDVFSEQQKQVEIALEQDEAILDKILNQPQQISMSDFNLYKNSKSIQDRLKTLVARNKDALIAMRNEKSKLSQILSAPLTTAEIDIAVEKLEVLGAPELFWTIMKLKFDYTIFKFLASNETQAIRNTLFNWIKDNINQGIFHVLADNNHDLCIEIFNTIYQHDNENRIIFVNGMKEAKEKGLKHDKLFENPDDIFSKLLDNKAEKKNIEQYADNVKLLTGFKNKIIETSDLYQKLHIYYNLFNLSDNPYQPQLYQVFLFLEDKYWEFTEQRKIVKTLEIDFYATVEKLQSNKKAEAAFNAAVAKQIELAKNSKRYKGRYGDIIPMTEIIPRDQKPGFFKPAADSKDDELVGEETNPYFASIKPLGGTPEKLPSKVVTDKDELDEQIAKVSL